MRKVLLSLFAVVLSGSIIYAQDNGSESFKADAGNVTVEVSYSPTMHFFDGSVTTAGHPLSDVDMMSYINTSVRYFFNPNMAVRLKMGIGSLSTKNVEPVYGVVSGSPDPVKVGDNTTTSKYTSLYFVPGFEYHFNGFKRVSPYVGAEIGLGGAITKDHQFTSLNSAEMKTKTRSFAMSLSAFSGVDVYICQGFYIGFEVGVGYAFNQQGKSTNWTVDTEGKETKKEFKDAYNNTSLGGLSFAPAIRIGWTF